MGRVADLGLRASGRVARVAPCIDVPEGELVELPGRGQTYLVDTGPGQRRDGTARPTLVLLHALACTGLLTWYPAIAALRERYRVVAFDQRWHGQGIMSDRFTLEDCADDVAAVADVLELDRFVAVGYSMGSLIAQLTWRQHADRVAGVVLCASTARFVDSGKQPAALRIAGDRAGRAAVRQLARSQAPAWHPGLDDNRWALAQFRSTTGSRVTAATAAISRFDSTPWISELNAPAAVVVTSRDKLITPSRQRWLARQIHDATVYEVDAGHAACVLRADKFTPALLAACASVSARAATLARP